MSDNIVLSTVETWAQWFYCIGHNKPTASITSSLAPWIMYILLCKPHCERVMPFGIIFCPLQLISWSLNMPGYFTLCCYNFHLLYYMLVRIGTCVRRGTVPCTNVRLNAWKWECVMLDRGGRQALPNSILYISNLWLCIMLCCLLHPY